MDRRIPTQYVPIAIAAILLLILCGSVVAVGAGSVSGFLWNVDYTEDVEVSSNEKQIIEGIKVYSTDHTVRINVGEIVEKGAELDENASAYDLRNGQKAQEEEVFVENPNTSNATIIINDSAIDSEDAFDVKISGINTQNVTKYNRNLSRIDTNTTYVTSQDGQKDHTTFNIKSSADVILSADPYNQTTGDIELERARLINNSTDYIVVWKTSTDGDLDRQLGTVQGNKKRIPIDDKSIEGTTNIAVTTHPDHSGPDTNVIHTVEKGTIKVPIPIKTINKPIYYYSNSSQANQSGYNILFEFNTEVNSENGEIDINYYDEDSINIDLEKDTNEYNVTDNILDISTGFGGKTVNSKNQPQIQNVSLNNISSDTGGELTSKQNHHPNRISKMVYNSSNITVEQGTQIGIATNASRSTNPYLRSPNKTYNVSYENRDFVAVNTSNISLDKYTILTDSEINGSQLEIIDSDLSPQIPNTTTYTTLPIQFDSVATDRHILVDVYDENHDFYVRNEFAINKSTNYTSYIDIPKEGQYHIDIRDANSGRTYTQSTEVIRNKEVDIELVLDANQSNIGDTIYTNLSGLYENTIIKLTGIQTNSTVATIELATPTEGNTSIGFNTYAVGNASLNDSLVTTGAGATVESVETSTADGTLPPGTYEIDVHSEHGTVTTSNETTVTLRNRSTNGVAAYTTTSLDRSELGSADEVRDAITDGTLAQSSTIGTNDTVVYGVNASGLTGLPTARNATLDTGADLERIDGFSFGIRPTNASDAELTTSDDIDDIGDIPENSTVHLDETGLYLVADSANALATDGDPTDGEEFVAKFRVDDDRLREATADPGGDHAVSTDLTFSETGETAGDGTAGDGTAGDETTGGGTDGGSGMDDGTDDGTGGGAGGGGATGGGAGGTDGTGGTTTPGTDGETTGSGATSDTGGRESTGGADRTAEASLAERRSATEGLSRNADRFGVRPIADLRRASSSSASIAGRATPAVDPASDPAAVDGTADRDEFAAGADEGPTPNPSETGDSTETDNSTDRPSTPSYEDAPIRTTADDVPGFGPVVALAAIVGTILIARYRRRDGH